jgi:hypothetical protein
MTDWRNHSVMTFAGSQDTHKSSTRPYRHLALGEIFDGAGNPADKPKADAPAIIPSSYNGSDGRTHEVQRERGSFVAICGDVDAGNADLATVECLTAEFFGADVARLIYSTSGATAEAKRWRTMVPLARPVGFQQWNDAAEAYFTFMELNGVRMDWRLSLAGQHMFLPNVPMDRRGADSQPVFYDHLPVDGKAATLDTPKLAEMMVLVEARREAERGSFGRHRDDVMRLRAARSADSPIALFNRSHPLKALLSEYGYASRDGIDWQSPYQTSGSYATRVFTDDNGRQSWVSLSESDNANGLGERSATGCRWGDAFDLYVHFAHGGDSDAALLSLDSERIEDEAQAQARNIAATPYRWRDPRAIPPRPWLLGRWLLEGTVACVVAPGGVGKSTFLASMALSVATGRVLLGKTVEGGRARVWVWNLEDDLDELSRSVQAAAKLHGVSASDLDGFLYLDSAMEGSGLCTAVEVRGECKLYEPVFEAVVRELLRLGIKVLVIDPFVSSHAIEENSNSKIDMIVKAWGRVAKAAGCVVVLVHHTSKAGSADVTANSARGASALVNAARSVLTINRMGTEEAKEFGIPAEERRRYLSVADDKHNRAPAEMASWFELVSVDLGNGTATRPSDSVAAVMPWALPEVAEAFSMADVWGVQMSVDEVKGGFRQNPQASDWIGHAVASAMGLDASDKADRAQIKRLVECWVGEGFLAVVRHKDDGRTIRPFIEVGTNRVPPPDNAGVFDGLPDNE